MNSYYNHGGYPAAGAPGSSAAMRAELDSVTAGFDRLPALGGNAGAIVVVNASANGLTTSAGGLDDSVFAIFDNLDNTKIGKFQLSGLTTGQTRTLTWPDANTVIVGTDVLQTLSNKTLTNPTINAATLNGTFAGDPTFSGTLVATGSVTFTSTLAVGSAVTLGSTLSITTPTDAVNLRSGLAGQYAAYTLGRTALEAYFGISGGAGQIVAGDVAGDVAIRNNSGRLLFAPGGVTPLVIMSTTAATVGDGTLAKGVVINGGAAAATGGYVQIKRNGTNSSILGDAGAILGGAETSDFLVYSYLGNIRLYTGANERVRVDTTNVTLSLPVVVSAGISGAALTLNRTGAGQFFINASDAAGFVTINTAGAERLRVTSAGLVGVARTPTAHRLEVSGKVSSGYTIDEGLRVVHNDAYIGFYNTAESVRSGYIQMTSTGTASWVNEIGGATTTSIAVGGSTRLSIDNTGITNIAAGSGFLRMGGNVTRIDTNHGIVVVNAAFNSAVHRRPDSIRVVLECLTAEAGYAVGQQVDWQPMRPGFTGGWWSFSNAAGTQMTVQTLNATIQLPNFAGGAATNITPANWNIRTYYLFL